jgi:ATP:cob(I)alamin adenosyltransferase
MKLYTRTGDAGETGLFGGERLGKDHPRVRAYGDVDEANSQIGFARSLLPESGSVLDADLASIQNALFDLGADLATRSGSPHEEKVRRMNAADTALLERWTDRYSEEGPPFTGFVLPGGHPAAAELARPGLGPLPRRQTLHCGGNDDQPALTLVRPRERGAVERRQPLVVVQGMDVQNHGRREGFLPAGTVPAVGAANALPLDKGPGRLAVEEPTPLVQLSSRQRRAI